MAAAWAAGCFRSCDWSRGPLGGPWGAELSGGCEAELGSEEGKKMSRCSLVGLGVVGVSLLHCNQKGGGGHEKWCPLRSVATASEESEAVFDERVLALIYSVRQAGGDKQADKQTWASLQTKKTNMHTNKQTKANKQMPETHNTNSKRADLEGEQHQQWA